MSQPERAAADVCLGDDPYNRATVTTADGELLEIPAEMRGKFCFFAAQSLDVWIRFGTSNGVDVDATQTSSLTGAAITTPGAKVPHLHVPAGTEKQIRLQGAWTHMAHISSGTAGFIRFGLAQGHFGAD